MTIFIRILDVLTFLVLLLSLQFSYGRRFNRAQNAFSVLLLCLFGLVGTILEEQVQGINFFLYAVNFILWGSVYSYFCLKGQFGLKLAMTTVFCVSVFYSFEFAHLLGALFHVPNWRFFSLPFILLSAVFLYMTALHSTRKVSVYYWGALVAASVFSVLGYTLRYRGTSVAWGTPGYLEMCKRQAFTNLCGLLTLYILFFLVSHLIRHYESSLTKISLRTGRWEQTIMSEEINRLTHALRLERHENQHRMRALTVLLEGGNTKQALKLLDEFSQQPISPNTKCIHTGNAVVDAILNKEAATALQKGIAFHVDASLTSNMPVSDSELVSLISNLVSNAMEASEKVDSPEIDIHIFPTRCYLCIKIQNRANIELLRSNPEMHTTKHNAKQHGFGLSVIRGIAEQHDGSADFTVTEDGWFIAKVMLLISDI